MAGVVLAGVYLSPVADPTVLLRLNAGVKLASEESAPGDFRRYAGGRTRLIRQAGRNRSIKIDGSRIDQATREQLTDWTGELLLLRDGRGRKHYGAYLEPQFTEQPGLSYCSVSLTFVEVTVSEAV